MKKLSTLYLLTDKETGRPAGHQFAGSTEYDKGPLAYEHWMMVECNWLLLFQGLFVV